jgi:hypothetical protein
MGSISSVRVFISKSRPSSADRVPNATLAQLVEQLTRNEQVVGSSPTGGSKGVRDNEQVRGWIPRGSSKGIRDNEQVVPA